MTGISGNIPMGAKAPLVEVRNLKKYFKTKKGMLHAVDDVSFSIR